MSPKSAFGLGMSLFYILCGIGLYFLDISKNIIEDASLRLIFAVVLVIYGLYRFLMWKSMQK